jgi:hypothetical protein
VLRKASEKTYDLIVRKGLVNDVPDDHVKKGLDAARQRQIAEGLSDYDRLRAITYADDGQDHSAELTDIVSTMKIERQREEVHLVYEARNRYPHAVADSLLNRVRAGRTLFYGADDILAALLAAPGQKPPPPENPMSADRVRWEHIQRVYELCGHNVSETARRLNMHRRTLQRILAKRSPR